MPNDDQGERSEAPTARRRQEAREEGQVPRSADLNGAAVLLAGLLLLSIYGGAMRDGMIELLREMLDLSQTDPNQAGAWLWQAGASLARLLTPFLAFLMLAVVIAGLLQTGLLIVPKKLQPKLENLSPMRGVKRLFSLETLTRFGMSLVKVAIVGGVAYFGVLNLLDSVLAASAAEVRGVLLMSSQYVLELSLQLALVLLVLALLDFAFQRYRNEQQLKMTKQDVRDEFKKMEGDPLVKSRRRRAQQQLAMQRISRDVPQADVVVTNPTEYAVALRYDETSMTAPKVVAKGVDFLALRIRQIAQQHGVPVLQRPPLARGLYAAVDVGEDVPPEYYRAVAEVLAYVYQLSNRAVS